MPGFFTGLLEGFNKTSAEGRAQARKDEDAQAERESKMLSSLAQVDDPEISSAAISAMAEIANGAPRPKGGYLQRIVGAGGAAVHPALKPILDLLHTPGALDVALGRARGATTASSQAGASGGAGAPAPGGPPVVAPLPAPPTRGAASVPSGPMTQGGPPTVSALGTPGGPAMAQPAGLAPMVDTTPARDVQAPPAMNAPPQADTVAMATSAPAGAAPQLQLPQQGQMTPGFNRTIFTPPAELARQKNQQHAEGIELDLTSKVTGALKLWDAQHPAASAEERQDAHDQILEHELGTAPKWTNVPGTVTGDLLPPGALDNMTQPIGAAGRTKDQYYVRRTYGGREQFLPTSKPATATNAELARTRVTNDRDAIALELFKKKYGELDQPSMAAVNQKLDQRNVNLARSKAQNAADINTAERTDRTSEVTVMRPDRTFSSAKMNQQGDLLDKDGRPLGPEYVRVATNAALPPKIDAQGKTVLTGLNVMRATNERLKQAIEDAGLTQDNNPIPVRWDKFLYDHGVDPGDLATKLPFSEYAQLGGTSEAYGLRGLIGGRPNQTLIDIYNTHLAQPGNTPALIYKKLGELDRIMNDVETGVIKAQDTQLTPHIAPAQGKGGTAPKDVRMKDPHGNIYDVHPDDVAAAKAKKWTVVSGG